MFDPTKNFVESFDF